MHIKTREHIYLRTIERGVGETAACGSNAGAAVCAGILNGWLAKRVKVEFNYGSLEVAWEGGNTSLYIEGPAHCVYMGEIPFHRFQPSL